MWLLPSHYTVQHKAGLNVLSYNGCEFSSGGDWLHSSLVHSAHFKVLATFDQHSSSMNLQRSGLGERGAPPLAVAKLVNS